MARNRRPRFVLSARNAKGWRGVPGLPCVGVGGMDKVSLCRAVLAAAVIVRSVCGMWWWTVSLFSCVTPGRWSGVASCRVGTPGRTVAVLP